MISAFEWLDIIKNKPLKEWPPVPDEFLCYSFKGHLAITVGGAIFGYDASTEKWNMEGII